MNSSILRTGRKRGGWQEPEDVEFQDVELMGDTGVIHATIHIEFIDRDQEFIERWNEAMTEFKDSATTIGGHPALDISDLSFKPDKQKTYVIVIGKRQYSISAEILDPSPKTDGFYRNIFQHIISSFRFV